MALEKEQIIELTLAFGKKCGFRADDSLYEEFADEWLITHPSMSMTAKSDIEWDKLHPIKRD